MEKEIWKDIEGYEGLYIVSDKGNVINIKNGGKIKRNANLKGYRIISLWKNGIGKMYRVHRLVAQAFIPNPERKPCIDHINGNRSDNRVENLRWVTNKENQNNPVTKNKFKNRKAKAHHEIQIEQVKNGVVIKIHQSIHSAARELNITATNICAVCRGKGKSYKGFVWRYKRKEVQNNG